MDPFVVILKKIYYDPKNVGAFGGVKKLLAEAKKQDPNITKDDVEKWLASQDAYTLFKPVKRKFLRLPIVVNHVDEQWQADLLDMSWYKKFNDQVKYLLVVIDIFSRYAWIRPIRDKSADSIVAAFGDIIKQGRKPIKLQTDQGKEFVNSKFKKFLKSNNIEFFTTTDDMIKCAIVERFNRTIRTKIYRLLHHKNSHRYIDDLASLVESYNKGFHRSIGRSPESVNPSNEEQVRLYVKRPLKTGQNASKFQAGDHVRISRKKSIFEKGTTSNWSEELFKIDKKIKTPQGFIYKLTDLDGEPITSIFYQEELNKVDAPKTWIVEKIIKRRLNPSTKKLEFFVKWLGYPEKFNSWVEKLYKV